VGRKASPLVGGSYLSERRACCVTAGKAPLSPKTGLPMGTELVPNHTFRQILAIVRAGLLCPAKGPASKK
jgi:hypothetical protein